MHIKTSLPTLIFSLLLGLIHFTSCKSTNKNEFATFPNDVDMSNIRTEEIRIDNCFSPIDILVHDSVLLLNDTRDANMFLKMYNSQSGDFIKGVGAIGNGPNEYINPSFMKFFFDYDAFWLMEPPKRRLHRIPLNQIVSPTESNLIPTSTIQLEGQMLIADYYQISDTTLLIYNPTSDNLYSEISINGNIVKTYSNSNNRIVSDNFIATFLYYRGAFTVNNNKAFLFYSLINKITRFDFGTMIKTDRLGDNYIDIIPEVHESGNLANNYASFSSNANTYNNLVLIAYNGGSLFNEEQMRGNFPNTILAFNAEIEPIAKLTFPFDILNFTICKKGMLYVIPGSYDGVIYKYDLNLIPSLIN